LKATQFSTSNFNDFFQLPLNSVSGKNQSALFPRTEVRGNLNATQFSTSNFNDFFQLPLTSVSGKKMKV